MKMTLKHSMNLKNLILKFSQTKLNYYLGLDTDFLTAILFLTLSIIYFNGSILKVVFVFISGVIFFTFLEYAIHAWLFHKKHFLKIFIEGHAHHHQDPFSYDAMPFFMSFVVASILAYILNLFISPEYSFAFVGGLTLGYFNYGILHHLMHRMEFKNKYLKHMQEFHFVHHKKPKMNHGVTTDIWDKIFGTYYQ